jgi:hypothetical protein
MADPSIAGISPSRLEQRSVATLVVTGANFTEDCTVRIQDMRPDTEFISATKLRAKVGAVDTADAGDRKVRVHRSDGAASNEVTLTIYPAPSASRGRYSDYTHTLDLPTLSDPAHNPANEDQKADAINTLFDKWGSAGDAFKPYIILAALNKDADPLLEIADDAQQMQGKPVPYCPFAGSGHGTRFQYIKDLVTNTDSQPFFAADPTRAVCVLAETFSTPLVYGSAKILSAAVMAGLITRLLLQAYADKWRDYAGKDVKLVLGVEDIALVKSIRLASAIQINPARWKWSHNAWNSYFPKPTANSNFDDLLSYMTDACSCQGAGMVMGWSAGDSILATGDEATRLACVRAVWRLVGVHFTTHQIGVVVAYTLNYLIGFARNQRTVEIINGTGTPSVNPTYHGGDITLRLHEHVRRDELSDPLIALTICLFKMVVDEFYAIEQKTNITPDEKKAALTQYRAFIGGFQKGSLIAAESIFSDTFRTGYSVGYARGFRDGYAQGYAAGYHAGYVNGFADGKKVWGGITQILHDISGAAEDIGNFLKEAKAAGTVITTIAALL